MAASLAGLACLSIGTVLLLCIYAHPCFPAFRARLAALGRRTARQLRQNTLEQLAKHLADLIPAPLLSSADEGANSGERIYSLRLTCECFFWQMLQFNTACREVVRQVQTLARLQGWGAVDEGNLHSHDLRLLRQLWDALKTGDILLGDRADGDYVTLAGGPRQGVDVVARLHQRRTVDFRKARRLGQHDGLFVWRKGEQQSTILSPEEWAALPEEIEVRIVRFTAACRGFRSQRITLVTTLLDAQAYPAAELIALYARRWRLELCLRDVKTTLGLETLRSQSPAMVRKELLAGLIAHNLIRCVMVEAARVEEAQLERLSFKGAVDALRQFSGALAQARTGKLKRDLWQNLLSTLARDLVPRRPNRSEPRAVKRRPKPYPLLNRPRRKFVELPHRSCRWKGGPRKYQGLI